MQLGLERMLHAWAPIRAQHVALLLAKIEEASEKFAPGDARWVGMLTLPMLSADRLAAGVTLSLDDGRDTAISELRMQSPALAEHAAAAARPDHSHRIDDYAQGAERLLAAGLVQSASTEAFRLTATSDVDVAGHVATILGETPMVAERDVLAGMATGAVNEGRMEAFASVLDEPAESPLQAADGPAAALYALEILDKNTCTECAEIDGQEYFSMEQARKDYPGIGGGYVRCLGRTRCRGTLVIVHSGEAPATAPQGPEAPPEPPAPPPFVPAFKQGDEAVVTGGGQYQGEQVQVLADATENGNTIVLVMTGEDAEKGIFVANAKNLTLLPKNVRSTPAPSIPNVPTGTNEPTTALPEPLTLSALGTLPDAATLKTWIANANGAIEPPGSAALKSFNAERRAIASHSHDMQKRGVQKIDDLKASGKMTQAQRDQLDALFAYGGFRYTNMNSLLRSTNQFAPGGGIDKATLAETRRFVTDLQRAYTEPTGINSLLEDDVLVYRGLSMDITDMKAGAIIGDPGFLSTSTEIDTARSFAGGASRPGRAKAIVRLHVRQGEKFTPGLTHDSERELIFEPGSRILLIREIAEDPGARKRMFDGILLREGEGV